VAGAFGNVWQAMGGMEMGSIWGHGSYVAPDWTSYYLHRECLFLLDSASEKDFAKPYDKLTSEPQAMLRQRLQDLMRKNNYEAATGRLTLEPVRAEAFEALWFHDQSANRALLHAGPQYDRSARTWRSLRRLRHARPGANVVLFARDEPGCDLETKANLARVLGHQ
jgi:hypothetical protein